MSRLDKKDDLTTILGKHVKSFLSQAPTQYIHFVFIPLLRNRWTFTTVIPKTFKKFRKQEHLHHVLVQQYTRYLKDRGDFQIVDTVWDYEYNIKRINNILTENDKFPYDRKLYKHIPNTKAYNSAGYGIGVYDNGDPIEAYSSHEAKGHADWYQKDKLVWQGENRFNEYSKLTLKKDKLYDIVNEFLSNNEYIQNNVKWEMIGNYGQPGDAFAKKERYISTQDLDQYYSLHTVSVDGKTVNKRVKHFHYISVRIKVQAQLMDQEVNGKDVMSLIVQGTTKLKM